MRQLVISCWLLLSACVGNDNVYIHIWKCLHRRCLSCSTALGVPGQLWQRHAQKERDRAAHLRPPHPDPSVVVVRQDHFARRDPGLHRGRVKSSPPSVFFFCAHVPSFPHCPLTYWSTAPSNSTINCATCKKKLISNNGVFQDFVFGCWWVTVFYFVQ